MAEEKHQLIWRNHGKFWWGSFLLSQLKQKLGDNIGLYRDDSLGVTGKSPRETEKIKKEITTIFKNGLRITIEANKKSVNFLDVTLNLAENSYSPYSKPNSIPLYVNQQSSHPPLVLRNIPAAINRRLSALSSNKKAFNSAAPPYQKAIEEGGYNFKLEYEPPTNQRRKNRPRNNIVWFNPPFSKSIETNIG